MKKVIIIGGLSCVIGLMSVFWLMTRSVEASALPNPVATVKLSNDELFKIELYPELAPNTVANFISLAESGFYKGTYVNRVMPKYLVQAGDPIGNGYGFPGYFIQSECKYNGFSNRIKHIRGTVSMARGREFDTEGSQFFVLLKDAPHLNGQYAAFGKIIEGLEIIENLSTLGADEAGTPLKPIWIEEVKVETYGKDYAQPYVISIQEQREQDV